MAKSKDVESKVVFIEGDDVKVLRGVIESQDDVFIYLKRKDGVYSINKKNITKIFTPNQGEVDE